MPPITTFQDLEVWREAHKLVLMVYRMTASFPTTEQYGLTSQMRRASVSVPANIVEGFRRSGRNDKLRFYNIAQASLEELKYFFILSEDLRYVDTKQTQMSQAETVGRLLHRFSSALQQRS